MARLWAGRRGLIVAAAAMLVAAAGARADSAHGPASAAAPKAFHEAEKFDRKAALDFSQSALGRELGDYSFLDSRRRPIHLSDFRGKPLIVNMVYTACVHACPLIVSSLANAVEVAQEALGQDSFNVITIGFDTRNDTPEQMGTYARARDISLPNWGFLSTDAATVRDLAADLGFIFYASPAGFDHLAQTTVIDADGRVYNQIYGTNFGPPALVEPLKRMAVGEAASRTGVSSWIDRIRLFCTLYDPVTERYKFDYSIFIGGVIGAASLLLVAVVLVRAWRRGGTRRKA